MKGMLWGIFKENSGVGCSDTTMNMGEHKTDMHGTDNSKAPYKHINLPMRTHKKREAFAIASFVQMTFCKTSLVLYPHEFLTKCQECIWYANT